MEDTLSIRGGKLAAGDVNVSGFKHLAVPAIASTLLLQSDVTLKNVPSVEDADILCEILQLLGAKVEKSDDQLKIDSRGVSDWRVPGELSSRVHGSLYLIPTLLGRFGRVQIGDTGGCRIGRGEKGERPVHHVVEVLRRFGATVELGPHGVFGQSGPFRATEIDILDWSDDAAEPNGPLVSGATKTAILASLAVEKGETVIRHPYWKPDVTGLLEMLTSAGASIESSRQSIRIQRPTQYEAFSFELLSDLGEIVTWLTCSLFTGTDIRVGNLKGPLREGLAPELSSLKAMGVEVTWQDHFLTANAPATLRPIELEVRSHGIYSDHHPLFTLLATGAAGESIIRETVWANRFRYTSELKALGADLRLEGPSLLIRPCRLRAATRRLRAPDLRAAAVLVLAALTVDGSTELAGMSQLRRGYPSLICDLKKLGACIDEIK